jgi:hypothetical protein
MRLGPGLLKSVYASSRGLSQSGPRVDRHMSIHLAVPAESPGRAAIELQFHCI